MISNNIKQKRASTSRQIHQGTKKNNIKKDFSYEQAISLLRQSSEATTIDDALGIITNKACALVGGKGGSIWLRSSEEKHRVVLRWTYRQSGSNIVGKSSYTNILSADGFYEGLTGWVFGTGNPLMLNDITDEQKLKNYEHLKWSDKYHGFEVAEDKEKQKHFMAVPIFSCRVRREVIGVLRIGASKSNKGFNETHLDLLKAFAGYISGLLTNYIKQADERLIVEKLLTIVGQRDLELLLNESANTIPLVLDGCYCSIFLNQNGKFVLEATNSPDLKNLTRKNAKDACISYNPGTGKTGQVALSGNTYLLNGNITSKAGFPCECDEPSTFLATAIRPNNIEKPSGVVRVTRELKSGREFDIVDQQFLENFSRLLFQCLSIHGYFSRGTCFVIIPFDKSMDKIYYNIIKPTVEKFDLICRREDEFSALGQLSTGIISHIANANLIIAEITHSNPNVYYELGVAHTLEKIVILMSQNEAPSDVRHWKYISYQDTAGDAPEIINKLESTIHEAITNKLIRC